MESNIINIIDKDAKQACQTANPKYHFVKALRPFSLPVALITCSLGIAAGLQAQTVNPLSALLVLLAGLFLQAGVNLINDYADLKNPVSRQRLSPIDINRVTLNYRLGWICFVICAFTGLYLAYQTSLFLLALAMIGGLGALCYTTEPIHYKRRGLGVILVFFLMGVLMVYGACYAVTGQHYVQAIFVSIPVSFFTSALLLANEIRDYNSDQKEGLKTLTVRWGLNRGKKLYAILIACGFASMTTLIASKQLWVACLMFIPAIFIAIRAIHTSTTNTNLKNLPPITGRLYLVFGASEIIFLMI